MRSDKYGCHEITEHKYYYNNEENRWVGEIIMTQCFIDDDTGEWGEKYTALMGAYGKTYDSVFEDLNNNFEAYLINVKGDLSNDEGLYLIKGNH